MYCVPALFCIPAMLNSLQATSAVGSSKLFMRLSAGPPLTFYTCVTCYRHVVMLCKSERQVADGVSVW